MCAHGSGRKVHRRSVPDNEGTEAEEGKCRLGEKEADERWRKGIRVWPGSSSQSVNGVSVVTFSSFTLTVSVSPGAQSDEAGRDSRKAPHEDFAAHAADCRLAMLLGVMLSLFSFLALLLSV